ncbi:DUF2079 domain-containing protein [Halobaculum rubrum]|uniref:DUF2079 domain-containing protein n=1 Tax=Halobaculum rubrum TaxID=2872158 RepID=UPI001CA3CA42|nr:DUF2079 domain-containing protein [Halobaculum rubrum]QZY00963.1 DUF2079 domain-containing protein [Halobaculum rubrum]
MLAFAVGLYPVFRLFADRYGARSGLLAIAVVAFHPYAFPVVAQGFRPLVFTGTTLPWLVYFLHRGSNWGTVLATVVCLSTHMAAVFLVAPISVWFFYRDRQLVPAGLAIAWFVLASQMLFPTSNFSEGGLGFPYGSGGFGTIAGMLTHPVLTFEYLIREPLKLVWIAGLVGIFGLLPLFTSFSLVLVPYFGINLLQTRLWAVIHPLKQRTVAVVPLLMLAVYFALDSETGRLGLARVRSLLEQAELDRLDLQWVGPSVPQVLSAVLLVTLLATAGGITYTFGAVDADNPRYQRDQPMLVSESDRAAWALIDHIPEGVPVKTTYMYSNALAQRSELRLFPPKSGERYPHLEEPSYILLDRAVNDGPQGRITDAQIAATIESENTVVVAKSGDIVLLKEHQSQTYYWNRTDGERR